ncbi:MAG: hypothetical protein ACOYXC_14770 [Candidatus Rifleibacteriota bacterium]
MKNLRNNKGFALLLVLGAGVASLFLVAVFLQMGSGVRNQITLFNRKHQAFLIANHAYSKVMGQLYSKPWLQRPFKTQPLTENSSYAGGDYELFVEDSPGRDLMVDVYVNVKLFGKETLFFWRSKYNDDLLDFAQNSFFGEFSSNDFPSNNDRVIANQIEDMVMDRKNNQEIADELSKEIAVADSLSEIVAALGGSIDQSDDGKGVPPSPTFPPGVVAAPTQEIKDLFEKDSRFEVLAKFYQIYLGRGPDAPGASYWLSEHPDVNTPEGYVALCQTNPGFVGRKVCIERLGLKIPEDNTLAVYYEMTIHMHWIKNPGLPEPGGPEFADAAIEYVKTLPPMPADFVVKDFYLGGEWEDFFESLE